MYNRYVPQSDGSYQRNFVQDPVKPKPRPQKPPAPPPCPQETPEKPEPPRKHISGSQEVSIGNFLKQLLPREMDTGDLFVILLLLLMSGDCPEDRNNALLTIFLYLFL